MVPELRQVFRRVSLERAFAAIAAQEDDLAGDDDARRRPHRAKRLVRHRAELLALGEQPILGRELRERLCAVGRVALLALASGPPATALVRLGPLRSSRPRGSGFKRVSASSRNAPATATRWPGFEATDDRIEIAAARAQRPPRRRQTSRACSRRRRPSARRRR